jgi:hypothetical protein
MMSVVGTLVTLDLPDDSPALSQPWIITFGPADDEEEWEPVVCGPYERAHALALAEAVLADEEVMAVVEPLQPALTVDQIRGEIAASRLNADEAEDDETEDGHDHDHDHDHEDDEVVTPGAPPAPEEIKAAFARIAQQLGE